MWGGSGHDLTPPQQLVRIAAVAIFAGLSLSAIVLASDHFAYAIQLTLEGWSPSLRR